MRDKAEVLGKLEALIADRLKKRKRQFLSRTPSNCSWNTRLRVKDQGRVGFCQNTKLLEDKSAKVFVCNQDETAESCPCFECRNTEETVTQSFYEILKDPARVGKEYPKIAILLWFIQDFHGVGRWTRFKRSMSDAWSAFIRLITMRWW